MAAKGWSFSRWHSPKTRYPIWSHRARLSRPKDWRSREYLFACTIARFWPLWIRSDPPVWISRFWSRKYWHSVIYQKRKYFEIPVQNIEPMEGLEPNHRLYEHTPDLILFKQRLGLLMFQNLLVQISIICILHNNTSLNTNEYQRFFSWIKTSL